MAGDESSVIALTRCQDCGAMYRRALRDRRSTRCVECRSTVRTRKARERRAAGFCPRHPDRPTNGKSMCAECLEKHAARNSAYRKSAADKGVCPYHSDRPVAPGQRRCAECLSRMAQDVKRSRYGLGRGEWDAMFARQGCRCQICGTDNPGKNGWHTDHDHATGAVRGILCLQCNAVLGYAKDDQSILMSAIEYLRRATPVKVRHNGR